MRFDKQESGAGGWGALSGSVTGIGLGGDQAERFGGAGRLQGGINPSWFNAPFGDRTGVLNDGLPWDYYGPLMWWMTHEIGHRWTAALDFIDNDGVRRPLDDGAHWLVNLHTPSAVTLGDGHEASPMGGPHLWLENNDGTFTDHLSDSPSGYGFLDLYAMGLMEPEEVPDFFLLENVSGWVFT